MFGDFGLTYLLDSHGAQGTLDGASKATLENEFDTHDEEEIIKQIIEKGTILQTAVC